MIAPLTRLVVAVASCVALVGPAIGAKLSRTSAFINESVLLIGKHQLLSGQLPATIQLADGKRVFSVDLVRACLGKGRQSSDQLLYFPATKTCRRRGSPSGKTLDWELGRAVATAGEISDFSKHGANTTVILVEPFPVGDPCSCPPPPDNRAPVALVESGSPQTVFTGVAIGPIVFSGADGDSSNLTASFSWTLTGGPSFSGLPGGLGSSCQTGPGTIVCTVTGSAPASTGGYLITAHISDGSLQDSAAATLTVTDELPELIFFDGFESN